jgi:hypothetical protein
MDPTQVRVLELGDTNKPYCIYRQLTLIVPNILFFIKIRRVKFFTSQGEIFIRSENSCDPTALHVVKIYGAQFFSYLKRDLKLIGISSASFF